MGTKMPLMDEFKEEREEIKKRSFKEKASYFWDYYKWHVIGIVAALILIGSLAYNYLTNKDTAYYSAFLNMNETWYSEDFLKGFEEISGVDTKKEKIYFDSNLHLDLTAMDQATFVTTQKLLVYISSQELDSMLGDLGAMNRYGYNDVLMDLRDFLTPEEIEKYQSRFFYVDRTLIEKMKDELNDEPEYPADPTDPTSMTDPVPVGIYLNDCEKLSKYYVYSKEQCFAVLENSIHPELNRLFFEYLMGD